MFYEGWRPIWLVFFSTVAGIGIVRGLGMKAVWASKTLGEVCGFVRGPFGGSLKKSIFVRDGFAVYEQQHAIYDQFDDIRYFIDAAKFSEMSRFELRPHDLIMSCSGTMGKVAIVPPDIQRGIINQALLKLTPAATLMPHFLKYWMDSPGFQNSLKEQSGGAAIQNVASVGTLKQIKFACPPLPEQQRIVTLLDEAFDGIATAKANAEKNLQNARAIFESQLEAVFANDTQAEVRKPLGSVCDLQNGYAFKSGDYIGESNTLNIRMSGIRPGGTFDPEHNQRFLPDSYAQAYANFLLEDGDLIIAMTDMAGDPKILGVPTLVSNRHGRNFLMNQRVGKLFGFSDEVRVPYLRYFLSSPTVKLYYKNKGAGGLQINISKGDILSAQIPMQSIENQDRVVEQLDSMTEETQRLESIYQQKLTALDELKKSLLHRAFNGDL